MSIPRDIVREHPCLGDQAILIGYRGSIAHGTYVPNTDEHSIDDKDVQGICVPPREYYLGLSEFGSRGTKEIKRDPWDIVVFEARKAFRMLSQGNPNVLSLLWLPQNGYIKIAEAGQILLEHRQLFAGKHVYKPFVGYATGQLRRMTHQNYAGYMGEKRKRLVDKFGYDVKNASHLVRILREGIEFLSTGELQVQRPDAPDLIAIKNGEWSQAKVQREAERLFALAQEALVRSKLPDRPDFEAINRLCVDVVEASMQGSAV